MFTFLPIPEIETIMVEHQQNESKRVAQHKLAKEFVELIHGLDASQVAESQHRNLFNKDMTMAQLVEQSEQRQAKLETHPSLAKNRQAQDVEKYGTTKMVLPRSAVIGRPMSSVLWSAGFAQSKSEAQRLINAKGAYIAGRKDAYGVEGVPSDSLAYVPITNPVYDTWKHFVIDERLFVLRSGKWRIKVIEIIPDAEFVARGLKCPGFDDTAAVEVEQADLFPANPMANQPSTKKTRMEQTPDRRGWTGTGFGGTGGRKRQEVEQFLRDTGRIANTPEAAIKALGEPEKRRPGALFRGGRDAGTVRSQR
jgi:tyrosyl-tRNA synthetase